MKRRDFICKSGLASATLMIPETFRAYNFPRSSANETVNIGIIGTGDRGSGAIPLINGIGNFNVIGCSDILPFRLDKALAKVDGGKAKAYKDYRYLLDNKNIDAVLVATPFNTHSQIAIDALDAGKHVYCEKTMAKTYEGIDNLVAQEKKSNTIFQTGHQYRSSRLYRHAVGLIKDGKVGTIQTVECQWNRNGDWRRPVPKPEYEKIINWRMYREFSGGLLAELCSHQLDFVNWILEAMPNQVMGVGGVDYWKDGRETYDNIHLIYSYPNGVKAKFTCLTANAKDGYKIKVIGDKGTLILEYARAWFYPEGNYKREIGEVDGVSGATISWKEGKGIPIHMEHTEPTLQALIDFRDNVVDNKKSFSGITTGANAAICVQMGLDAMYKDKIIYNNSKE
ncbi:Gfo/Idh/MocA family oxidoreductase [Flagellimonas sp. HMM57]|uniref:Gfo/Idh/MocA family protein n=1 Tax=unclassified Flagellimonas TaxID=2644544 RepID=UPI0013D3078E|nr:MULTISPECIES: Gfo/Idh/MocA family oxidoreductase [unclassified Flagellimonas]UII77304.1 Gfo/Idh/MocA family oxidoreductase [Flagellimonas sp. HMM57]